MILVPTEFYRGAERTALPGVSAGAAGRPGQILPPQGCQARQGQQAPSHPGQSSRQNTQQPRV